MNPVVSTLENGDSKFKSFVESVGVVNFYGLGNLTWFWNGEMKPTIQASLYLSSVYLQTQRVAM